MAQAIAVKPRFSISPNTRLRAPQGVLYLLLEEMTDQHIKEVLLAFFVLMQSGALRLQHAVWAASARFSHSRPVDSSVHKPSTS